MGVGIDASRHDKLACSVDNLCRFTCFDALSDLSDGVVTNEDVCTELPVGIDDGATLD
jgi:hypothetical protein